MSELVTTAPTGAAPSSGATPTATPASSTPASATATPSAGESSASAGVTPAGEPPKERWPDILDNARNKTRSEVEAEYRQKYGWADQFQSDPYPFVESWIDQLSADQRYSPQLLAKAARLLQSRRGTAQPAPVVMEEPQPTVPIADANGNITGYTFDASGLKKWQEWNWNQRQSALDERLQPLEALRDEVAQARSQAQIERQATEHATTTLAELRQDPYFAQHEAKVKAALIAHPEWGDDVKGAWLHVLRTEVYPSIGTQAEASVREQFKTQAAGATVHPGSNAASAPPKFKDFGDALRYYAEHPQEAEVMAKR